MFSSMIFGPGDHYLDQPLVLRSPGQRIIGAGAEATRIFYVGSGPAIRTELSPDLPYLWGAEVGGFTLYGGGIEAASHYKSVFHDIRVRQAPNFGIRLVRLDPQKAFSAYNTLSNISVDMSGVVGNGVVLDAGSEINCVVNCNGSYAQQGAIPANHTDEPSDLTSGIGLLIASGNNTIVGGHWDRCVYGVVYLFAESNDVSTATDNSLARAVLMKGAKGNTGRLAIGRMDPSLPDGSLNPRYGLANWAAVHATNVTAGNRTELRYRADSSPPPLPVGRSSWPRGGWSYALWENTGTGNALHGGANRWIVMPEGQMPYKLDGAGVIVR